MLPVVGVWGWSPAVCSQTKTKGKNIKSKTCQCHDEDFPFAPQVLLSHFILFFCTIAFCLPQQIFKKKNKVICKVYGLMATLCYCSGRNIKLDEHTSTDLLEPLLMFFEFRLFFLSDMMQSLMIS